MNSRNKETAKIITRTISTAMFIIVVTIIISGCSSSNSMVLGVTDRDGVAAVRETVTMMMTQLITIVNIKIVIQITIMIMIMIIIVIIMIIII